MIPSSACPSWQPEHAANAAQESPSYTTSWGTIGKYHKRFLREIEQLGPALPLASFTRRAVIDLIETFEKNYQCRQCAAVLKNLFKIARYYGIVSQSEMDGLRLKTGKPRDRIWSEVETTSWLAAADLEDPHMITASLLLQYTAQPPSDVLAMTWAKYRGGAIILRQKKTDALLDVPCHPVLREHLDGLKCTGMMIVMYRRAASALTALQQAMAQDHSAAKIEGALGRHHGATNRV